MPDSIRQADHCADVMFRVAASRFCHMGAT
jgi:hypothetical protein